MTNTHLCMRVYVCFDCLITSDYIKTVFNNRTWQAMWVHGAGVWLRLVANGAHITQSIILSLICLSKLSSPWYILFESVCIWYVCAFYFFVWILNVDSAIYVNSSIVGMLNINDHNADKQPHEFDAWRLIISYLAWLPLHQCRCALVCFVYCACIRRKIKQLGCATTKAAEYFLRLDSKHNKNLQQKFECSRQITTDVSLDYWSSSMTKLENHHTFIMIYLQTVKDKWAVFRCRTDWL